MDLNHLRLFVQVADSEGFTPAAAALGMQRSSVSRGIAALERELDVQLFQRSTRSVVLSSTGEALYAKVAGHLASLEDALEALPERQEEPSGQLRVTVPHDLGADVFPRAMAGFARRFPKVQVNATVTNRVVDLVAEGFDAALRPGPDRLPDSSLKALRLSSAAAGVYASPSYLARSGTPRTLDEAKHHDWVLGPAGARLPIALERPPVLVGDDMMFVRAAVVEHLGLGFLPSFLVSRSVVSGHLVRVLLGESIPRFFIYLLMPPTQHAPRKLRVFRDYLLEYFRVHPLAVADG